MPSRQTLFFILFLFLVASLVGAYTANLNAVRQYPGGRDYDIYWSGMRYFLLQNVNPYSTELGVQIRREVFGVLPSANAYPYRLEYPFYILLFYLPLSLIGSLDISMALWMLLLEVCMVTALLLNLQTLEWRPNLPALLSLMVFSLFWYFGMAALLDGNASILLLLFLTGILAALRAGVDDVAGILLALSTFKWEAGGLLVALVLLWVISTRRWRALVAFGIGLVILLMLTTVLVPDWPVPFYSSVLSNLRAGKGFTAGSVMAGWWPGLGDRPGWALTILLAVILFLEWRAVRGSDFRRFVWVAALTLAATPLLGLPVEQTGLVLLVFPVLLVLSVASERWRRFSGWALPILLILLIVVPWLLLRGSSLPLRTIHLFALLSPIGLILALYWLKWWAIRPPRVWADLLAERSRGR